MSHSPFDTEPIAAHPTLRSYYDADEDRQQFVNDLFDRSSSHYDRLDKVLSLGSGSWYRAEVLRRAGLREGMSVLDVATGTGPLAEIAQGIVGASGQVIGLDPSRGMLNVARERVSARFVQAVGEALPIRDQSFDLLVMGYALRHVGDLRAAFREYHRVLKAGGKLVVMELSVPRSKIGAGLLRRYMSRIVPLVVRLGTRSRDAERLMQYYWETMANCVPPETILEALRSVSFGEVRRDVQWGILTEYHATK